MNPFFIVNETSETPEILVYGYIGMGDEDVNAGDFIKALRSLEKTATKIHVRINSGGGSVFEGIAIYNAMKNSKCEIITFIDGLAASMGSVIALGGSTVHMSKNARIMTHRASGVSIGSASSMKQSAALLESMEETIATIYATKTGLPVADVKSKFLAVEDKWMTAEEAMKEKLIDCIFDAAAAIDIPPSAKSDKDVWQVYNTHFTIKNDNTMKQLFLTAEQLGKLNLKAEAPQTEVTAAVDALIAKAAQVDDLTAKLNDANTKLAAQDKAAKEEKVTTILNQALNVDKKINKAQHDKLKADYASNPEGLQTLLATFSKYHSITDQIDNENNEGELAELMKKDYQVLDREGKLPRLKELSLEGFKAKYKARFNKDYKG